MSAKPPKLPRFQVPKDLSSKVFKTKKDKAKTRRVPEARLKKELKDER